jgi:hypothetical protein
MKWLMIIILTILLQTLAVSVAFDLIKYLFPVLVESHIMRDNISIYNCLLIVLVKLALK